MSAHVVVFITAGSIREAQTIARALVEEHVAACVTIVSPIQSVYRWQGKVCDEQEVLLIAKTVEAMLEKLTTRVKQLHSYEVPEIIALPIVAGAEDYLRWIYEQTRPSAHAPPTQTGSR
jgi:periplasmic divalent cation tolerance protein